MALDLLIRNGTVVDGTGSPRFQADVSIVEGRIVEIGRTRESARRTIDADGLIVAPGFIDPHTHYDAQIWWDPLLTCSSWHGVTSVVVGNCGVGIAPCRPEVREVATWDLVNVEGIPFDVLSRGIDWEWESFPEFMNAAERRGLGPNVGFLAPLTPFRHFVMGEESMERAARADEADQVAALLREAIGAGALGFTTTTLSQHIGYQGRPLACRLASRDELTLYAHVLRDAGRGAIELALTESVSILAPQERELLDLLLRESGRPVTWLALLDREDAPDAWRETLRTAESLVERGAIPQVTCRPAIGQFNLRNPFLFANIDSWKPAFNQPVEKQMALYAEPTFREAFRKDLEEPRIFTGQWDRVTIREVGSPSLTHLEGRTVADVARERQVDGLDAFLDVAIEAELQVEFTSEMFNANEARLGELISDPRTFIGLSDGGAHVDMLCDAGYPTFLLGTWVRDRQVLTLERAVQRITSEPARFFGLADRGTLEPGMAGDVAIFDEREVGSDKQPQTRDDLPGGGRRLVMPARGVHYSIVNGVVLYESGRHTGELPGRTLRA